MGACKLQGTNGGVDAASDSEHCSQKCQGLENSSPCDVCEALTRGAGRFGLELDCKKVLIQVAGRARSAEDHVCISRQQLSFLLNKERGPQETCRLVTTLKLIELAMGCLVKNPATPSNNLIFSRVMEAQEKERYNGQSPVYTVGCASISGPSGADLTATDQFASGTQVKQNHFATAWLSNSLQSHMPLLILVRAHTPARAGHLRSSDCASSAIRQPRGLKHGPTLGRRLVLRKARIESGDMELSTKAPDFEVAHHPSM